MNEQLKDFLGIVFRIVKWVVTGIILIFVPFLAVWLGSMWLEDLIFHNSTDIYFFHRDPMGNIVTILLAILIMSLIVTTIPTREQKRVGFARTKKFKRKIITYIGICVLLLIWDATNHIKVNQEGITTSSYFGLVQHSYKWTDLKEIQTGYHSSERNGFHPEYNVILKNDRKLDLWSWSLSNKIGHRTTDGIITANQIERAKAILYIHEQVKKNIPDRVKSGKCISKTAKETLEKMYADAKVENDVLALFQTCQPKF